MQRPRESFERTPLPGHGRQVEDFTVPFLWVAGALTFMALVAISVVWSLPAALIIAVAVDRVIPRR